MNNRMLKCVFVTLTTVCSGSVAARGCQSSLRGSCAGSLSDDDSDSLSIGLVGGVTPGGHDASGDTKTI